jgi:spermidine/putrescine transport system substrate-binding protein
VIEYNGDIAQVMRDDPDLDFVIPREGGILASDGLCIPRGAPNPDLAHAFIDFVLRRPGRTLPAPSAIPPPTRPRWP